MWSASLSCRRLYGSRTHTVRTGAVGGHEEALRLRGTGRKRDRQRRAAQLRKQPLAHAFVAVAGDRMAHLVPEHDGQSGVVLGVFQDAGVDGGFRPASPTR